MLWTRRRVREPRGRHRAAATPAAPPVTVQPVTVQPVPVQPVSAPALAPHSAAWTPGEPGSGVHLGFADGTALELASGDPRISAFRAVARTLRG